MIEIVPAAPCDPLQHRSGAAPELRVAPAEPHRLDDLLAGTTPGILHRELELWSATAWVIYAVLAGTRVAASQSGRQAALSAVAGFAFLLFAVVGVGLLA